MIEIQLYIPAAKNDGTVHPSEIVTHFQTRLARVFGGYSIVPGSIRGGWLSDELGLVRDSSTVYVVAVANLLTASEAIHNTVALAKRLFEQEAIYVRYLDRAEIL